MNEIIIAIGTNQGNRIVQLTDAIRRIREVVGETVKVSSIIESEPWGYHSTNWYLNQVIGVASKLDPMEAMLKLQEIEKNMGRIPSAFYTDRPIDLDILDVRKEGLEDDERVRWVTTGEARLRLPHPRLHERKFVLLPLAEIYPEYRHPVLNKGIDQMIDECADRGKVRWFNDLNRL